VLNNVTRDYPSAVEALKAATALRPGDYSLFNKLGATLANSHRFADSSAFPVLPFQRLFSRSAEALPAYYEALRLKPKYARGWLNLGISHANLQNVRGLRMCCLFSSLTLSPMLLLLLLLLLRIERGGDSLLLARAEHESRGEAHLELHENGLHHHGAVRPCPALGAAGHSAKMHLPHPSFLPWQDLAAFHGEFPPITEDPAALLGGR
jgi:hypothetical protein